MTTSQWVFQCFSFLYFGRSVCFFVTILFIVDVATGPQFSTSIPSFLFTTWLLFFLYGPKMVTTRTKNSNHTLQFRNANLFPIFSLSFIHNLIVERAEGLVEANLHRSNIFGSILKWNKCRNKLKDWRINLRWKIC